MNIFPIKVTILKLFIYRKIPQTVLFFSLEVLTTSFQTLLSLLLLIYYSRKRNTLFEAQMKAKVKDEGESLEK